MAILRGTVSRGQGRARGGVSRATLGNRSKNLGRISEGEELPSSESSGTSSNFLTAADFPRVPLPGSSANLHNPLRQGESGSFGDGELPRVSNDLNPFLTGWVDSTLESSALALSGGSRSREALGLPPQNLSAAGASGSVPRAVSVGNLRGGILRTPQGVRPNRAFMLRQQQLARK